MANDLDPPLILRFGRLGDLVLTWPALASLARRGGPVDLVTSERYVGLMEPLPWLRRVWSVEARGGAAGVREVWALARRIRRAGHGPVVDLHGGLRSRLLAAMLGGAARRVSKGSLRRRLRVGVGAGRLRARGRLPLPSFPQRFLDAVGAAPGEDAVPRVPALPQRREIADPPALALLPGARRATKRWPPAAFGALAARWFDELGGEALVFHGPGEEEVGDAVIQAAGGAARRFEDLDLWAQATEMGRCAVAVGGDSGLLHLAAAAGARPVGLFGPTGAEMGYWPWGDRGTVLVPDLPCHPCSLYGDARCPLEHHDCLQLRSPDEVFTAAVSLLEGAP